ncbi:MAG: hypothetical protein H8E41_14195 [Desulfobulbaceae bacterium]|uniref:Outer membrane protein assembly factor BamE n=1 Tax=Candidatus Desulfobia pelagia TaxID=2841692 RepID=A0A8J6NH89_9BACT|nr:hypothetical protein [Candidatus Desulfobia pelagia]
MNILSKILFSALLLTIVISTQGCSRKGVGHLASDICMISKGITQNEVLTYLGPPHERKAGETGETWVYYQVKKSTLRKTPFIGNNLGTENVEMATVQFSGDKVITCVYRSFKPDELQDSGISLPADDSGSE